MKLKDKEIGRMMKKINKLESKLKWHIKTYLKEQLINP
jgi:hypothetical protein